jgi:hypothetical protein
METNYIKALETRASWLRWAREGGLYKGASAGGSTAAIPLYINVLESGDTFFMNSKFCSLVEHARETVPDDLAFDPEWMQSKQGFLWIEDPFEVPHVEQVEIENAHSGLNFKPKISAIGWRPVTAGEQTAKGMVGNVPGKIAENGATQFLCFLDLSHIHSTLKFSPWSYFMLQPGEKLIDRIKEFEGISIEVGGQYKQGRESETKHEIRWIYSAFYLMAQRLAANVTHNTHRQVLRRNAFKKMPVTPFIRVITLRRLEEARKKDSSGTAPDWQWQWSVRGHWRNQYLPSTGGHRPVFVESYIKGPEGKPLKDPGVKLFVAGR